ncbi:MAG: Lrp/AsnC family transcriptional regulator [Thaumarchaeota archaeon]|nr:Lrp/AsnC family transcriptional regulator [Nitrososphaerota archaeon]
MSVHLDDLDRAILNMLQRDARTSYSDIAKKYGTAEATVRFRVKRLVKEGVISAFVAFLNPTKIGFTVSGAILLKLDPTHTDDIISTLIEYTEISYIYRSTGEYDVIAVIYAHDMQHFNALVKGIKMLEGVEDVRISVTTEFLKSNPIFKL